MTLRRVFLLLVASAVSGVLLVAAGQQEVDEDVDEIQFWTIEDQPERVEVQEEIAASFEAETGISVDIIPVRESDLPQRVTAAFAANDLPDVMLLTLEYAVAWASAGILDSGASQAIVNDLGQHNFAPGAIEMADYEGETAAVPMTGWSQLFFYRQDQFDEHGLDAPTDYDAVLSAIDALHDSPNNYGFTAPTDPSQNFFNQVFEFVALANGVDLIDDDGNVVIDSPEMITTLEFYRELADASPSGNLNHHDARDRYLGGETSIITWSPYLLDELAGLDDDTPVVAVDDPTSSELAEMTSIIAEFSGPDNDEPATYTHMSYLGVPVDAERGAAMQFIEFIHENHYEDWMTMDPSGMFPTRWGDDDDPERFRTAWGELEIGVDRTGRIEDFYDAETVDTIVAGLDQADRWGFRQGEGELLGQVYESMIIPRNVRDFIDGEMTAEETAAAIAEEVEDLLD